MTRNGQNETSVNAEEGPLPQNVSFPMLIHSKGIKSHYWVWTFVLFLKMPSSQHSWLLWKVFWSWACRSFLPLFSLIGDWPNKESAHFSSITATSLLDKFLHPHLISILQPLPLAPELQEHLSCVRSSWFSDGAGAGREERLLMLLPSDQSFCSTAHSISPPLIFQVLQ